MYVQGIVPGVTAKTYVIPVKAAALDFARLVTTGKDWNSTVSDHIAAGNFVVLPEILVEIIAQRLREEGAEGS